MTPRSDSTSVLAAADPPVMFRICTLPVSAIDDLALGDTADAVRRTLVVERALLGHRDALSEALGRAVPRADDRATRRAVLDLRRKSFTGRRLPLEALETARGALDAPTLDLLETYSRLLAVYEASRTEIDRAKDRELPESLRKLRQWVSADHFLEGLALASPVLTKEVLRYLGGNGSSQKHDDTEAALIRYFVRTCIKTSPFSKFTAVGNVTWDDGPTPVRADGRPGVGASLAQLSVQWLFGIEHHLASDPVLRRCLPLRVNQSVVTHNGRIEFVKRQMSRRSFKLAANSETIVSVAATPLTECFSGAGTDSALATDDVIARIVETSGGRLTAGAAEPVLARLLDVGLLRSGFDLPTSVCDLWTFCLNQIPAAGPAPFPRIHDMMCAARTIVNEVAHAKAARRLELFDELAQLQRAFAAVASVAIPEKAPARQFVFEDSKSGLGLACSRPHWQSSLDDLRACALVHLVSDGTILNQYDMAAEYLSRFGAQHECRTFHEFYRDFLVARHRRLAGTGQLAGLSRDALAPHTNAFGSGDIDQLNTVRARLSTLVSTTGLTNGTVHLEPTAVRRLAADCDYPYRANLRAAVFCMRAGSSRGVQDEDQDRLVVNMCGLGFGKFESRFCWLLDGDTTSSSASSTSEAIRLRNRAAVPDGTVLAEMNGLFGAFGVDSHPPLTDYQIEYPGETSTRPFSEMISLRNLRVRYCAATRLLELYSPILDKRVWPVHLGFLAEMHLPPVFRGLMEFAPPLSMPVGRPTTWRRESVNGLDIVHAPRVVVGEVVLGREEWAISKTDLPFHLKGKEFWLELHRFRDRLGLPTEVFRRSDLFAEFMADNLKVIAARAADGTTSAETPEIPATTMGDGTGMPLKPYRDDARKPMFLSFDSYHLVEAFRRSAPMQGKHVIMAEVFPRRAALCVQHQDLAYATEFVVELGGL